MSTYPTHVIDVALPTHTVVTENEDQAIEAVRKRLIRGFGAVTARHAVITVRSCLVAESDPDIPPNEKSS